MKRMISFGLMLLFTVVASAQIQGDIVDQKDKGVPNAIIIATDTIRNVIDTAKSDNRGFYSFTGLKPGIYKIEIKAGGFQSAIIKKIIVREEDTGAVTGGDLYRGQRLDITLTPAKVPK